MAIETTCQTCRKRLRVGDEHAGKLARCPACQTIYTVPQSESPIELTTAAPATELRSAIGTLEMDRWHLKTPDGLTFGPVSKAALDQWQREGRIVAQSLLIQDGNSQWLPASAVYPQLASPSAGNPFADNAVAPINPYAPPNTGGAYWPSGGYRNLEPHRGGLILTLSIVGFFFCPILSVVTIVMGSIDFNKIARGRMDPGGRGLTIAGLIIASLHFLLYAGMIALAIFGNGR